MWPFRTYPDVVRDLSEGLASGRIAIPAAPADDWPELSGKASPSFVSLLSDLSRRTGDEPGRVIAKAVAMLKFALDARDAGKAVGTAESADWLETEWTGF